MYQLVAQGVPQNRTHPSSGKIHVAALDGLRFIAAFCVAGGHYAAMTLQPGRLTDYFSDFTSLGMTLFFVLSGFVIHYNYGNSLRESGGLRHFFVARFSRLYPLYLVLFLIELVLLWRRGHDSCGQAGDSFGSLFALPYYLTMTQDWFYGTICKNNLVYQFGMMGVTWSISAEVFFYVFYCFYVRWAHARRASVLFAFAGLYYASLFLLVREIHLHQGTVEHAALIAFGPVATVQNGYENSLVRWLYYLCPLSQLVHFVAGVAIAQSFLSSKPMRIAPHGEWLVLGSVVAVIATHACLFGILIPFGSFESQNIASSIFGPAIVLAVYTITMFPQTLIARLLSLTSIVKLGEASYSLYLLHAFLAPFVVRLRTVGLHGSILWGVCIGLLLCISRANYIFFERPARRFLRKRLDPGRSPEHAVNEGATAQLLSQPHSARELAGVDARGATHWGLDSTNSNSE